MSPGPSVPDLMLRLYGKTRATPPDRRVTAGGLSFVLDGMALRWICWHGIELLRGIAFVVRDRDWGTYVPQARIERDDTADDRAHIVVSANIGPEGARLACRMTAEATAASLTVMVEAIAEGDFETNRTGFVILHPASCAGQEARIEHANGSTTRGRFPKLVSPHQPFFDIRSIEHQPATGVRVTARFEGDVFEMEDQRNWSDASFKTYSRPLALPFPYVIQSGEAMRQAIKVRVGGTAPAEARQADGPVRVEIGGQAGVRLPRLGIGGRPQDYAGDAAARARLAALCPSLLVVELDAPGAEEGHLDAVRAVQEVTGAEPVFMLRRGRGELARLAECKPAPTGVALANADATLVEEARRVFPNARIGAGTDAFFAEFNRKPPVSADFVFWSVNPTVHAEDDASVIETLAVLTDQADTARAHCPRVPLWCGPVTLRMRFNPNVTGPVAMGLPGVVPADVDARQRGLFGAAFTLGQIAAWAAAGIESLVLYAPFGPRGVVHVRTLFPIPWYDDQPAGMVYPPYLVLAGLAGYGGREMRAVAITAPQRIAALAVEDSLWLANLGPLEVRVAVSGNQTRILNADSFLESVSRPEGFWDRGAERVAAGIILLGPYAVARVTA